MRRLAPGQHHEQPPQAVPVVQIREVALLGAAEEAVKGAQDHVLLVGHAPGSRLEGSPGQAHQAVEVVPPDVACGLAITVAGLVDPARDRTLRCHWEDSCSRVPGDISSPIVAALLAVEPVQSASFVPDSHKKEREVRSLQTPAPVARRRRFAEDRKEIPTL
jgi:hypothetical protein